MELKYLRLIKTIVEEGNISNSANRLFLTQSALSHQLRDLEESLGFKVFHRSRNKWILTDEGLEIYNLACKVFDEIAQGLERVRNIKEGAKGRIRISTECYSFYHGLPDFIQKMGVLYPEIEIDLVVEATHYSTAKVASGELDIAIATAESSDAALKSVKLFEDEIFAVMHREFFLSSRESLEADDFSQVHLIIHSFPLETVAVHELFLRPNGITPQKITAIPLTEVSLEMVNANMGITCLPRWALRSFNIPKELVFRKIGKNGLQRTHYLVLRKNDLNKKYLKDFIQNIEEEFVNSDNQ